MAFLLWNYFMAWNYNNFELGEERVGLISMAWLSRQGLQHNKYQVIENAIVVG